MRPSDRIMLGREEGSARPPLGGQKKGPPWGGPSLGEETPQASSGLIMRGLGEGLAKKRSEIAKKAAATRWKIDKK